MPKTLMIVAALYLGIRLTIDAPALGDWAMWIGAALIGYSGAALREDKP